MTAYNHYIVPRKSIIKHAQSIWQDYLFDHAAGELGFTNDGTMERRKQDKLGITKVIGYKLS